MAGISTWHHRSHICNVEYLPSVDYTCKNTVSQKLQTFNLSEFSMQVLSATREKNIVYATILNVRLSASAGYFKTMIEVDDDKPIEITNRFYLLDGSFEDRSRQYETFIRVLHFHLKEKSQAQFTTGFSWSTLFLVAIGSMMGSILVSFILYALQINFSDLVTQSFLLSTLAIGFFVKAFWHHFPMVYQPTLIPSQFLP